MDIQKNIFYLLGDWWASRQTRRRQSNPKPHGPMWLPTPGNAIFTLVMIGLLVAAQSVGALPLPAALRAPNGISTGTIAYQGRLADANGAPLTGTYNMIFRLYDAASSGTPLWEEQWTGTNGVQVSDGLFNVMLGSLTAMTQDIIAGHDQLFLGITVGTDDEMAPRVQLGSVPFAVQALAVPDGSITTAKIVDRAVTLAKLGSDVILIPPDGSVSTAKLADGAATSPKVALTHGEIAGTGAVLSLTTAPQLVPGFLFSVSPTTPQVLQLHVTLDAINGGTCGTVQAFIYVDDVQQRPGVVYLSTVSSFSRSSLSAVRQIVLPVGSHTVSIKARCETGEGGSILTGQSAMSYVLFSQ